MRFVPFLWRIAMGSTALTGIVVLLGLLLVGTWIILYQIMKQQGRMLLRLDEFEQTFGRLTAPREPSEPQGLAVGTPIPPFALPDLTGKIVTPEQFRGKQVLLIHWNPGCGFCAHIASDLAKLQDQLMQQNTQIVLLSHGNAHDNQHLMEEFALKCPVLLLDGTQAFAPFHDQGTPIAYLVDEQGQVAQPLAIGANQVPELVQGALERHKNGKPNYDKPSLAKSRIEREGLKAGTLAPCFELPDIYGHTVRLKEYRGRKVLLVFSDPHCGPCDQVAPALVRLHQEHINNGLAVVMIGRGDPEENRQKAELHHIEFPVALQQRWEISKEYGIFATPVAFLIDAQGIIAQDVVKGEDAIVQLGQAAVDSKLERTYEQAI